MVVGNLLGNLSVINQIKRPIFKSLHAPHWLRQRGPRMEAFKKRRDTGVQRAATPSLLDNRASNRLYASRHPGDSLHRV